MAQKTYSIKKEDVKVNWHLIDATDKVLGKTATEIVTLLMGKHKVNYTPSMDMGDKVVVINSKNIVLTGNKDQRKIYRWHTLYRGGLKESTAAEIREKNPNKLIINAVTGMLPKNRLRNDRLANLYVYEGNEHPHAAQVENVKKEII